MTIVLQILVALLVLVGLITTIMSIKNWHWAQMVLLLFIFFSAIGTLFLGLEVYRIHKTVRSGIPALEKQIADLESQNTAIERGTTDGTLIAKTATELRDPAAVAQAATALAESLTPELAQQLQSFTGTSDEAKSKQVLTGWAQNLTAFSADQKLQAQVGQEFDQIAESRALPSTQYWVRQLNDMYRQRGRVWRGAQAARYDAATGRVAVAVPQPKPHGLEKDAIVFAFQQGEPNIANVNQGAQYVGEFRVFEASVGGVILEPVLPLDKRGVALVSNANAPWSLYETMPADSYELFAKFTDEQLKQMLPPQSVEEYIRHGEPATADDDEYERAGYDDQGHRLGFDDMGKAVKTLYDRPLRDYAYLFAEMIRRRTVMTADKAAVQTNIRQMQEAKTIADKLTTHRTEEMKGLNGDLQHMVRDRAAIETLLAAIQQQLASFRQSTAEVLRQNSDLARRFAQHQLTQLQAADSSSPAAAVPALETGP